MNVFTISSPVAIDLSCPARLLCEAVLHAGALPGELVTTMATALAPPAPGGALLRVAGEQLTLVVRTPPGDMLVCRLRYSAPQGYRLLRRTLVRGS
ncbi:hypothetical protein [Pseudoduganella chitinolytica]|uniref:Uncharacterized protein n=1 Tax=Pseudoduganella chitinolytica TaxID=34070 RepID=A0ABY8BCJ4_9BURK|nr:hypothetical protein [Pseudoduganella chitinolytica]WEF32079.1 hypothetical protein PX653_22045 [Pseudoduganella chitinolytica]